MSAIVDDSELRDVGKFSGWLVLPALGLLIGTAREGFETLSLVRAFVSGPSLESLAPVVVAVPWLIFVATVVAFFFRKHRWAPYLYIVLLVGYVGFGGLYMLAHVLEPDTDTADAPRQLVRALVGASIWIPYFLRSRRVKLTFVKSW